MYNCKSPSYFTKLVFYLLEACLMLYISGACIELLVTFLQLTKNILEL